MGVWKRRLSVSRGDSTVRASPVIDPLASKRHAMCGRPEPGGSVQRCPISATSTSLRRTPSSSTWANGCPGPIAWLSMNTSEDVPSRRRSASPTTLAAHPVSSCRLLTKTPHRDTADCTPSRYREARPPCPSRAEARGVATTTNWSLCVQCARHSRSRPTGPGLLSLEPAHSGGIANRQARTLLIPSNASCPVVPDGCMARG